MKIEPKNYLLSVGQLADCLNLPVPKILAHAEHVGIDRFDLQLNNVGYFNATNSALIVLSVAKENNGEIDFAAPPVLVAEVERLRASATQPTEGLN